MEAWHGAQPSPIFVHAPNPVRRVSVYMLVLLLKVAGYCRVHGTGALYYWASWFGGATATATDGVPITADCVSVANTQAQQAGSSGS